jgi:hypothetical protein
MHFMSIEVAAQKFLFFPPDPEPSLEQIVSATEQDVGTALTDVPFSHNHLHDLESLWWVAVWMLFYNHFSDGTPPSFKRQEAADQVKLAQILFPLVLGNTSRRDGFQISTSFMNTCNLLQHNKKYVPCSLNILRLILVCRYRDIERGFPQSVDPSLCSDDIYDHFTSVFSSLKDKSRNVVLSFIPEIYENLLKAENSKRPRSESTDDARVAQKTARRG